MSPIDDELRRTLRDRADALLPAADPLSGIEQRARSVTRRRRTAAGLSGALVVVAGLAIALPQLSSDPGKRVVVQVATASPTPSAAPVAEPSNLLGWEPRGNPAALPPESVLQAVADAFGAHDVSRAHYAPLFTYSRGSVPYTIGQAWMTGDAAAHTFGYARFATGTEVLLGAVTSKTAAVVAFQIGNLPGETTDLLVLVPRPGTGQVSYSPDGTAAFAPVASGRSDLDAIGLVNRSRRASNDRVQVLDGDGNLDAPLYEGPVQPLLCAAKECG
ncbi:MAG: hypothetical protein JWO12_1306 [Frankiales bacterium]|nr:hypothetical protein [Frankiales bacterium]